MATLMIEQDSTGFAPTWATYLAYDDDAYDGPGSLIGSGETAHAAIADYLSLLEDDELEHIAWSIATFGENAAWKAEVDAELTSRRAP